MQGFLFATGTCAAVAANGLRFVTKACSFRQDHASCAAHVPGTARRATAAAGVLKQSEYQKFRLVAKDPLRRMYIDLPSTSP